MPSMSKNFETSRAPVTGPSGGRENSKARNSRGSPAKGGRAPLEGRPAAAAPPPPAVAEPSRQVARAVAVGVRGREHPAAAGPHAVVARLDAREAGDEGEGAPAVGRDVGLDLHREDGPPPGP